MKIALVCSQGGHLTEMLQLKEALDGHETFYITYQAETTKNLENAYLVTYPGINPFRIILLALRIARILIREHPKLILSTGSEIAILPFYLGKFLLGSKLVYVECSSQVVTPSRTGRLVIPITDLFLVQWESLQKKYGDRAQYRGGLI